MDELEKNRREITKRNAKKVEGLSLRSIQERQRLKKINNILDDNDINLIKTKQL